MSYECHLTVTDTRSIYGPIFMDLPDLENTDMWTALKEISALHYFIVTNKHIINNVCNTVTLTSFTLTQSEKTLL